MKMSIISLNLRASPWALSELLTLSLTLSFTLTLSLALTNCLTLSLSITNESFTRFVN